jgi:hypothetical protein
VAAAATLVAAVAAAAAHSWPRWVLVKGDCGEGGRGRAGGAAEREKEVVGVRQGLQ